MTEKRNFSFDAVFSPNDDGVLTVYFPDAPGCVTEGTDVTSAFEAARSCLALWLKFTIDSDVDTPKATNSDGWELEPDEFVRRIDVDLAEYYPERFPKKNVKSKSRPGRPKKNPNELIGRNRKKQINVYLTEEEFDALVELAEISKKSKSEYLRNLLREKKTLLDCYREVDEDDLEEDVKIAERRRI